MNVLVYIIPIALGLGLLGLFAFLWALRSGQYSDVDGAALRVLSDDDIAPLNPSPACGGGQPPKAAGGGSLT